VDDEPLSEQRRDEFYDAMIAKARDMGRARETKERARRWALSGQQILRDVLAYVQALATDAEARRWCYRVVQDPTAMTPDELMSVADDADFQRSQLYLSRRPQTFALKFADAGNAFECHVDFIQRGARPDQFIDWQVSYACPLADMTPAVRQVVANWHDAWLFRLVGDERFFMQVGRLLAANSIGKLTAQPPIEFRAVALPTYAEVLALETANGEKLALAKEGGRLSPKEAKQLEAEAVELAKMRLASMYYCVLGAADAETHALLDEAIDTLGAIVRKAPSWEPGVRDLSDRMVGASSG
jgi:hypothetical protein